MTQGFLRVGGEEFGDDKGALRDAAATIPPHIEQFDLSVKPWCESPVFFRTNAGGRFLVVVSVGRSSSHSPPLSLLGSGLLVHRSRSNLFGE